MARHRSLRAPHSLSISPPVPQFAYEPLRAIDFIERFKYGRRFHFDGSALFVAVGVVPGNALQVAIEDNADKLAGPVHNGTAGVSANDVAGADRVERRVEVELRFALCPQRRQVEGRTVFIAFARS